MNNTSIYDDQVNPSIYEDPANPTVAEILLENERRNALINTPYHPVIGDSADPYRGPFPWRVCLTRWHLFSPIHPTPPDRLSTYLAKCSPTRS